VRWERLFAELEAQGEDLEREERDVLVDELRDGDWSRTSWRDLLGGQVVIEVRGAGRVEGSLVLVNERLLQLSGPSGDHVVATSAVTTVHSSERRGAAPTRVEAALGWGQVLRALRDSGDEVRVRLVDGGVREGTIEVVGRDFVRLRSASGRDQVLPVAGIAVVSGRS
jgi:hypothetical protein